MGPIIYPLKKRLIWTEEECLQMPKSADSYSSAADSRLKTECNEALLAGFRQCLLGKIFHFAVKTKPPEMFTSD